MAFAEVGAEHRLLLACALAPPGLDLTNTVARACEPGLSWDRLLESAAANKMRSQLATRLPPLPALPLGARAAAAVLQTVLLANRGRGMLMAGELVRLLDALRAADILAVPFKGPVFATILGDGPGSREMSDLDILVLPQDVIKAANALAPLDYTAFLPPRSLASPWLTRGTFELPLLGRRDSILIELHWATSQQWYPAPCTVDDVMGRLTERIFFGCRVQWPAPEELFLVHVADGMKSWGCGIRWIADVVQIVRHYPDLDWDLVRRIAERCGGLNSVRVALAVADDLAGDIARGLNAPALAISLPTPAQALADDARRMDRLVHAVQSIRLRLQSDDWVTGAMAHFRWALRLADHPMRTAGAIIRYLSGPNVADLAAMPEQGESGVALRLRALRRRLGGAVR